MKVAQYDHFKPVQPGKDKKMKALLSKTTVLREETDKRLKEQGNYFNTEDAGYI